jgi:hypothetical protein
MNIEELCRFVSFHFEVGSALDTRVHIIGSGPVQWKGVLEGPRFSVVAALSVDVSEQGLVARARMAAEPGSRLFDMVLGCRLLCPPGILRRPSQAPFMHAGVGGYHALGDECSVHWGVQNSHFRCRAGAAHVPENFQLKPYIADESDGWRVHARVVAKSGSGYRRRWLFNRELWPQVVSDARDQDVLTERHATSPLYRVYRSAQYREILCRETMVFEPTLDIELPQGMLP